MIAFVESDHFPKNIASGDNPIPFMDEQIELTVGQTLQLFYKFGLSVLPIVNDRAELIGTFEKSDAVSLGTLRSRLEEKLGDHLGRLMVPGGPAIERSLKRLLFEKARSVPVLSKDGRLSHYWHVGQETIESELPMPYRDLFFALVGALQRPVAVVFQEPRAGEVVSGAFQKRLGIPRDRVRSWLDEIRWQGGSQDAGIAFHRDEHDLSVLLIRSPLRLRDQHFGWWIETREEYELAADCLCAERTAPSGRLRGKVGAQGLRRVVQLFEQYMLKQGMARSAGDLRRLTGLLGVSRQSLRYKLKKHRLASKKK
ncbi:MAG: hypothetical protein A3G34_03245 [Candidatus Lindowbacteria bacterium RIFCSPLOWO2_12_FULL_62_27]|nr:MAG: hypothetical protein A3I06_16015 [Candidatus Lindowbacteria bacterium RIFCSPLOWO2_02_FULL_62_12]OGH62965.1 MAG: hypothetical protein A3G34_03245 [Candidatus Lindowbacteria bacterium RIFCSPLOWO2_12_FULL_62_27]